MTKMPRLREVIMRAGFEIVFRNQPSYRPETSRAASGQPAFRSKAARDRPVERTSGCQVPPTERCQRAPFGGCFALVQCI
jgi:hypothetical protein